MSFFFDPYGGVDHKFCDQIPAAYLRRTEMLKAARKSRPKLRGYQLLMTFQLPPYCHSVCRLASFKRMFIPGCLTNFGTEEGKA